MDAHPSPNLYDQHDTPGERGRFDPEPLGIHGAVFWTAPAPSSASRLDHDDTTTR